MKQFVSVLVSCVCVCACVCACACVCVFPSFNFYFSLFEFFPGSNFYSHFLKTILCSSDKLPEVTSYKVEYSYTFWIWVNSVNHLGSLEENGLDEGSETWDLPHVGWTCHCPQGTDLLNAGVPWGSIFGAEIIFP